MYISIKIQRNGKKRMPQSYNEHNSLRMLIMSHCILSLYVLGEILESSLQLHAQ